MSDANRNSGLFSDDEINGMSPEELLERMKQLASNMIEAEAEATRLVQLEGDKGAELILAYLKLENDECQAFLDASRPLFMALGRSPVGELFTRLDIRIMKGHLPPTATGIPPTGILPVIAQLLSIAVWVGYEMRRNEEEPKGQKLDDLNVEDIELKDL